MRVVHDRAAIRVLANSREVAAVSLMLANAGQMDAARLAAFDYSNKGPVHLRYSMEVIVSGGGRCQWGSPLDYAAPQEFGTYKMRAHPYLRPSVAALRGMLGR